MRTFAFVALLLPSASAFRVAISLCHPRARTPSFPTARSTPSVVALIDPKIYVECAIYDADMEEKMSKLRDVVKQAEVAAKVATEQMHLLASEKASLKAVLDDQQMRLENMQKEVADGRVEADHLRENLQKQAASAAASAAAASSLEIEVTKLLRQLDEQGVAAAQQLKSETRSLLALLDDQSAAAKKARADAERADEAKRALREEIDERIIEASEARKLAEQLAFDLATTQEKNQNYLAAIEQIARVASTITSSETKTYTTSM